MKTSPRPPPRGVGARDSGAPSWAGGNRSPQLVDQASRPVAVIPAELLEPEVLAAELVLGRDQGQRLASWASHTVGEAAEVVGRPPLAARPPAQLQVDVAQQDDGAGVRPARGRKEVLDRGGPPAPGTPCAIACAVSSRVSRSSSGELVWRWLIVEPPVLTAPAWWWHPSWIEPGPDRCEDSRSRDRRRSPLLNRRRGPAEQTRGRCAGAGPGWPSSPRGR